MYELIPPHPVSPLTQSSTRIASLVARSDSDVDVDSTNYRPRTRGVAYDEDDEGEALRVLFDVVNGEFDEESAMYESPKKKSKLSRTPTPQSSKRKVRRACYPRLQPPPRPPPPPPPPRSKLTNLLRSAPPPSQARQGKSPTPPPKKHRNFLTAPNPSKNPKISSKSDKKKRGRGRKFHKRNAHLIGPSYTEERKGAGKGRR